MPKRIINFGLYRKCFNHNVFELLSSLNSISASAVSKNFSYTQYNISSVDGNTYAITLFINKLWDIILLKLTEVVHGESGYRHSEYSWDARDEWNICLSIYTIAECMGLPKNTDALGKLYKRIITAAEVLQNIKIVIGNITIDGYLSFVGVRDYSDSDDRVTKSDACFCFCINPALIEYIGTQKPGIYHFNHCWLFLPKHYQNTYAAAKRLGRHYSQNTYPYQYKKRIIAPPTTIGALRNCMPCLNSKDEGENRAALDNALKTIPSAKYTYIRDNETLTFEELKNLKLRTPRYNKVIIAVNYDDHPNMSKNTVTKDFIREMNDDALYLDYHFHTPGEAEALINHAGRLKQHSAPARSDDEAGTA